MKTTKIKKETYTFEANNRKYIIRKNWHFWEVIDVKSNLSISPYHVTFKKAKESAFKISNDIELENKRVQQAKTNEINKFTGNILRYHY